MVAMPTSPTHSKKKSSSDSMILFIPLAFIIGLGAGYLLWGGQAPAAADAGTDTPQRLDVSTDDDPSIGPADAPVTIIEFSDYQCPYCQLWYQQVFTQLMANYPNQIRFVYRDLPIRGHPEGVPAAEAADCAGEQNAYWNYHNALFDAQYGLGRAAYEQYASDLGLNMTAFTTCLDDHRYQDEVNADLSDAMSLGLGSTPTFLINGRVLVGALPYADFKAVIDEELAAQQ
jgi:protein-disulfide isomerase